MAVGVPVMVMLAALSLMLAPLPLSMVIPVSLISIFAPVAVFRTMPPVGPGASLMSRVVWPVVWKRRCAIVGGVEVAAEGTSPVPQKQPLQMGLSGSPPSNSTQTFASTGGIA